MTADLQLTSFRAPKGELAKARSELGYATNQEMIMDLIENAVQRKRQLQAAENIVKFSGTKKFLDPEFVEQARR